MADKIVDKIEEKIIDRKALEKTLAVVSRLKEEVTKLYGSHYLEDPSGQPFIPKEEHRMVMETIMWWEFKLDLLLSVCD